VLKSQPSWEYTESPLILIAQPSTNHAQPASTTESSSAAQATLPQATPSKGADAQYSAQASSQVQATVNRFETLIANDLLESILKDLNLPVHEWIFRGVSPFTFNGSWFCTFSDPRGIPERLWIQGSSNDSILGERIARSFDNTLHHDSCHGPDVEKVLPLVDSRTISKIYLKGFPDRNGDWIQKKALTDEHQERQPVLKLKYSYVLAKYKSIL